MKCEYCGLDYDETEIIQGGIELFNVCESCAQELGDAIDEEEYDDDGPNGQ